MKKLILFSLICLSVAGFASEPLPAETSKKTKTFSLNSPEGQAIHQQILQMQKRQQELSAQKKRAQMSPLPAQERTSH